MRLLVCGGRDYKNRAKVFRVLDEILEQEGDRLMLVQGGAEGADRLAREWAIDRCVPFMQFNANWQAEGKRAGPIRNLRMIQQAQPDCVLAFPGGKGTRNMITTAEQHQCPVILTGTE